MILEGAMVAFDVIVRECTSGEARTGAAEVIEATSEGNPHPSIARFDRGAFDSAIRARFGDLEDDLDGPLLDEVSGSNGVHADWIDFLLVSWSRVEDMCPILVAIAGSEGLAVYDPRRIGCYEAIRAWGGSWVIRTDRGRSSPRAVTIDRVSRIPIRVPAPWGKAMGHPELALSVAGGTRPRSWLGFKVYLIAVAALIALMQNPWLDPTGFHGRPVAVSMTIAWCGGLIVLALGVIRRHGSRFNLRTLVLLIAVIALYLGLCRAVHPVIPTGFLAYALSVVMLYEAHYASVNDRFGSLPFHGRLSRTIMAVAGLIFLAHFCRVLGVLVLLQCGVL